MACAHANQGSADAFMSAALGASVGSDEEDFLPLSGKDKDLALMSRCEAIVGSSTDCSSGLMPSAGSVEVKQAVEQPIISDGFPDAPALLSTEFAIVASGECDALRTAFCGVLRLLEEGCGQVCGLHGGGSALAAIVTDMGSLHGHAPVKALVFHDCAAVDLEVSFYRDGKTMARAHLAHPSRRDTVAFWHVFQHLATWLRSSGFVVLRPPMPATAEEVGCMLCGDCVDRHGFALEWVAAEHNSCDEVAADQWLVAFEPLFEQALSSACCNRIEAVGLLASAARGSPDCRKPLAEALSHTRPEMLDHFFCGCGADLATQYLAAQMLSFVAAAGDLSTSTSMALRSKIDSILLAGVHIPVNYVMVYALQSFQAPHDSEYNDCT